jgi:undecaprenyl pyrophosphate phosphatase UppP
VFAFLIALFAMWCTCETATVFLATMNAGQLPAGRIGFPGRIGRFANFIRDTKYRQVGRAGSVWIAVILAAIAFVLFGLMLFGCAQRYAPAPSAAATQTAITSTQTHIGEASQQNVDARTAAQRIHDKDLLIDRWNETHREKTP